MEGTEEKQFENEYLVVPELKGKVEMERRSIDMLSNTEVERALTDIFLFYSHTYRRARESISLFDQDKENRIRFQPFLLFARQFGLLRPLFSVEKLTLLFKKHATYGKYLTFDNFYFLLNSLAHEPEAKQQLVKQTSPTDLQTLDQTEKQSLYRYLKLNHPSEYKAHFKDVFAPFQSEAPIEKKIQYNYRKFSVPELRKKALPDAKEKKEKEFFIAKDNKQPPPPKEAIFAEAKSIVVSWDSLRAKSVGNLSKPTALVEKKYVRLDPEDDYFLAEYRNIQKETALMRIRSKVQEQIINIQQRESQKNKAILSRIQQKTHTLKQ